MSFMWIPITDLIKLANRPEDKYLGFVRMLESDKKTFLSDPITAQDFPTLDFTYQPLNPMQQFLVGDNAHLTDAAKELFDFLHLTSWVWVGKLEGMNRMSVRAAIDNLASWIVAENDERITGPHLTKIRSFIKHTISSIEMLLSDEDSKHSVLVSTLNQPAAPTAPQPAPKPSQKPAPAPSKSAPEPPQKSAPEPLQKPATSQKPAPAEKPVEKPVDEPKVDEIKKPEVNSAPAPSSAEPPKEDLSGGFANAYSGGGLSFEDQYDIQMMQIKEEEEELKKKAQRNEERIKWYKDKIRGEEFEKTNVLRQLNRLAREKQELEQKKEENSRPKRVKRPLVEESFIEIGAGGAGGGRELTTQEISELANKQQKREDPEVQITKVEESQMITIDLADEDD